MSKNNITPLGVNILKLCKIKNITQTKLAESSGITLTSLNRYIHGTRIPNIAILINIANSLGVTVDELTGEEITIKETSDNKKVDEHYNLIYWNIREISDKLTKEQKLKLIELLL